MLSRLPLPESALAAFSQTSNAAVKRNIFPDVQNLGDMALLIAKSSKDDLRKTLLAVAERLGMPASVIFDHGRPIAVPGIWGQMVNYSDCLADPIGFARAQTLDGLCFGQANGGVTSLSGRVPLVAGHSTRGTPPLNIHDVAFTLASTFFERQSAKPNAQSIEFPLLFIGNAAKRDGTVPTGAPFILAQLEGGLTAVVSGLDALSYVREHIVGDAVWKIDIDSVIRHFSDGKDGDTHFRSRYLGAAAWSWMMGLNVLGESIQTTSIPKYEVKIADGSVTTHLAHVDGMENMKLYVTRRQLEEAGLWGEDLSITINGITQTVHASNSIAKGEHRGIVYTSGSSWVETPNPDINRLVDLFVTMGCAVRRFHDPALTTHEHSSGLPMAGDRVIIR